MNEDVNTNVITITGYRTEGGDIFENVSDEKVELIYKILC